MNFEKISSAEQPEDKHRENGVEQSEPKESGDMPSFKKPKQISERPEQKEINVDFLMAEAKRFDEKMKEMLETIKNAPEEERKRMAHIYENSLVAFKRSLTLELRHLKAELRNYVGIRTGHFIDNFSASFSTKKPDVAISNTIGLLKDEDIPPVNIPAIASILEQIGLINYKLGLIEENKVLVSGYTDRI